MFLGTEVDSIRDVCCGSRCWKVYRTKGFRELWKVLRSCSALRFLGILRGGAYAFIWKASWEFNTFCVERSRLDAFGASPIAKSRSEFGIRMQVEEADKRLSV